MKKTTSKIIAVTALPILFVAVLVLYMTGILGSEKRKIDDIENYALSFDDLKCYKSLLKPGTARVYPSK